MKKIFIIVCATFAFAAATFSVFAHSGGTNSQGCHNNHKTGGYHCH